MMAAKSSLTFAFPLSSTITDGDDEEVEEEEEEEDEDTVSKPAQRHRTRRDVSLDANSFGNIFAALSSAANKQGSTLAGYRGFSRSVESANNKRGVKKID